MARFPVSIKLRHSFLYMTALVALHGVAMGCVFLVPFPGWVQMPVLLAIVCSLGYSLRSPEIVALTLPARGGLLCQKADGVPIPATVLSESSVFPWLVTLRFQVDGEKRARTLTLSPDHMSGEEFRLMRVWMRWGLRQEKEPDAT